MSVLHVNQIARRIRDRYEAFVPCDDLSNTDKELEIKLQTRCLAAFAVENATGCSPLDAGTAVTDGGEDNGLDAVYYSQDQNRLVIVQSKWIKDGKSEPDSGEIAKFCNGVRDLVNFEFERFNERLQKRRETIENGLSTFNCQLSIVLVHTGTSQLAKHGSRQIEDLLRELNDASEIATFENLSQERVYSTMAEGASGGAINLELELFSWGKTDEPHVAFYGMISGTKIAEWWNQHGELLFAKNLRSTLGVTDVNKQILSTIDERPADFWYFNNGITVTAKAVDKTTANAGTRDFGKFRASGAHVVNGAQTVSTIGRYQGSPANLDTLRIPVRVISLEGATDDYGALITRSNNTQNRIDARDFVSQDPEQQRLRLELQMEGIEYHISRSEGFRSSDKAFDLEEATISIACSLGDSSLAVQAKREIGRLWVDLDRAPYKRLFNPSTSAIALYNSVILHRIIEKKLVELIGHLERRSGKKYGVLVHGNRLLSSIVFSRVNVSPKLNDSNFSPNSFEGEIKDVLCDAVEVLSEALSSQFSDSFPAVVFKNPSKSKALFDLCVKSKQQAQLSLSYQPPSQQSTSVGDHPISVQGTFL